MLDVCLENNYVDENYIHRDFKKAIVETEEFTSRYISDTVYSLNLEINFVENIDFLSSDYETALIGFQGAIKAKSDHAFAHYYSAKCYEKLSDSEKANTHLNTSMSIFNEQPFWPTSLI